MQTADMITNARETTCSLPLYERMGGGSMRILRGVMGWAAALFAAFFCVGCVDKEKPIPTYIITFDANGGTVTQESGVTGDGCKLESLPEPERYGYAFNGWHTEETDGSEVTKNTVFTNNTTIYAQWTLNIYKITFDANGGMVTQENGTTGDEWKLESLYEPERIGYTFNGWYTEKAVGNEITENTIFTNNTTIYAQWTLNIYKITFDANGGMVTPESGMTGDGWKLESLPVPIRNIYTCNGWFTAAAGGEEVTTSTVFSNDAAIYAQWTPNIPKDSSLIDYNIRFCGNSITLHRPSEDIGWFGDWGMAASSKENDYVHKVIEKMDNEYKNYLKINYSLINVFYWERDFSVELDTLKTNGIDLLVIRLGENVDEEYAQNNNYYEALDRLIKTFKINETKVIVTDNYWPSAYKDSIQKDMALNNNYYFVQINDIFDDPENSAYEQFKHPSVAAHPSDAGMEKIAERIFESIKKNSIIE